VTRLQNARDALKEVVARLQNARDALKGVVTRLQNARNALKGVVARLQNARNAAGSLPGRLQGGWAAGRGLGIGRGWSGAGLDPGMSPIGRGARMPLGGRVRAGEARCFFLGA